MGSGSIVACLESSIPFSSYDIINLAHFAWSLGVALPVYYEENNTTLFYQAQTIQDFTG